MVASKAIIRVLSALASLTAATISASPIDPENGNTPSKRIEKFSVNDVPAFGLDDPRYYHFKEWDVLNQESETMQHFGKQQPLSLATYWGDEKEDPVDRPFFWFVEKLPDYKDADMGKGCQVVLYFDNIWKRADAANKAKYDHDKNSDKPSLTWAVPNAISPWCFPEAAPSGGYAEDALGYMYTRPDHEDYYQSAFVNLGNLEGEGESDPETTRARDIQLSFTDKALEGQLNAAYDGFVEKFMDVVKRDYTEITNPYKYGKGDPSKWTKTKKDSFYKYE